MLSHKHPDDYPHIAATLDDIRRTHKPFSTRHRIITVQGDVRDVVVIGERFHDNTGEIVGTQGFYLDVTPSAKQRQESISVALAEIADHRAAIEQAKGVLMYVYGIGPDAAFDILKWRSQDANIKLRALAEQLVADVLHTQARRRLSAVAPDVRPAATHRPRTSQSPRCLSARTWRPLTRGASLFGAPPAARPGSDRRHSGDWFRLAVAGVHAVHQVQPEPRNQ